MVVPQEMSEALTNSKSSINSKLTEESQKTKIRNSQFLKIYKTIASRSPLLLWFTIWHFDDAITSKLAEILKMLLL